MAGKISKEDFLRVTGWHLEPTFFFKGTEGPCPFWKANGKKKGAPSPSSRKRRCLTGDAGLPKRAYGPEEKMRRRRNRKNLLLRKVLSKKNLGEV